MTTTTTTTGVTCQLATSLADLRYEDLPEEVVARTEERAWNLDLEPDVRDFLEA
jgi:hypothetical protein